jgi:predicted transcriptional regulator
MKKTSRLWKVSELVESLLVKDKKCRENDGYLYFKVLDEISNSNGIDIKNVSVQDFLLNMHGRVFPIFETVRRTRQKAQELHPELCPCDTVKSTRKEKEVEYRDYALSYT